MHENVELEGKKEEKRHLSIHQCIQLTSNQWLHLTSELIIYSANKQSINKFNQLDSYQRINVRVESILIHLEN